MRTGPYRGVPEYLGSLSCGVSPEGNPKTPVHPGTRRQQWALRDRPGPGRTGPLAAPQDIGRERSELAALGPGRLVSRVRNGRSETAVLARLIERTQHG